jgi:superfamily II DNA helicase RecQ
MFHLVRRSNERHNIQFLLSSLTHGLGGDIFPDLLQYLKDNRKSIIYCATIELCWRVYIYLLRLLPPGPQRLRRVRLYHAMCWEDENEQTVRMIRDEPDCQVVVATVAFGQGFNIRVLLDSLMLRVPKLSRKPFNRPAGWSETRYRMGGPSFSFNRPRTGRRKNIWH